MILNLFGVVLRLTKPYFLVSTEERDLEADLHNSSLMDHHENLDGELPIHTEFGKKQIRQFFCKEINIDNAYILMLVCCLITGFVDGTLYNGK